MPKIKEPMMKRSTFSFFYWSRKSKLDNPVIISSLSFTPEICHLTHFTPTIFILPHSTLSFIVWVHSPMGQFYFVEGQFFKLVAPHLPTNKVEVTPVI